MTGAKGTGAKAAGAKAAGAEGTGAKQPGVKLGRVETLYEGWGKLLKVEAVMPDGTRLGREVEDHGDAAGVLAYDPARRMALLVRQLRTPMLLVGGQEETLECIAGRLEGDEPEACAIREADEEAGLGLTALEPVAVIQTMPGISTERIHTFLAAYSAVDRVGQGGGVADESENITVVEMPLAELAAMADDGRLVDAKTMLLLQTLRLKRPELFGPE